MPCCMSLFASVEKDIDFIYSKLMCNFVVLPYFYESIAFGIAFGRRQRFFENIRTNLFQTYVYVFVFFSGASCLKFNSVHVHVRSFRSNTTLKFVSTVITW